MLSSFIHWFTGTSFWYWINKKFLSKITFRISGYPDFPITSFFDISDTINKDITTSERPAIYFCTSVDRKGLAAMLIRKLTGSTFSHASIWLPDPNYKDVRLVHMLLSGINIVSPLELLREIEYFQVVKYEFLGVETRDKVLKCLHDTIMEHPDYDVQQELGGNKLSCSELIFKIMDKRIYVDSHNECVYLKSRKVLGMNSFLPDDVVAAASATVWKHTT